MRRALFVIALISAEVAHAGNAGILIPPVEIDVGVGAPIGANVDNQAPSMEVLAGVHWASLAWKPTRFDVGIGYVGSFRTLRDPDRMIGADEPELRMHGGYFSLATRIAGGKHWRTWLAARGELLRVTDGTRDFSALGASLRVATELFASGAAGARGGGVAGTIAIGVYAEVTYRELPAALGPVGFTSGLSCRLPFVVAGG
jgi:hypothetical protein